jgi:hypothetical protein
VDAAKVNRPLPGAMVAELGGVDADRGVFPAQLQGRDLAGSDLPFDGSAADAQPLGDLANREEAVPYVNQRYASAPSVSDRTLCQTQPDVLQVGQSVQVTLRHRRAVFAWSR